MALTGIYGPISRDTAIKVIRRALDLGITHFDTAEIYGHVTAITKVARDLGEDEDWLRDVACQLSIRSLFWRGRLSCDASLMLRAVFPFSETT